MYNIHIYISLSRCLDLKLKCRTSIHHSISRVLSHYSLPVGSISIIATRWWNPGCARYGLTCELISPMMRIFLKLPTQLGQSFRMLCLYYLYIYIWLYVIMWFHVDCVACMKPVIQPIAFRARVLWGLLTSTLGQMATHYFQLGSLSFCSCKNRGNNYCRLEQPEPHSWFENQHQVTQTLKCSSLNASGSGSVDKPWGTQKKINKERYILHCNWCFQRPLWTQPRGNPWACSEGGDTCTARKPCAAGGWKLCKPSKSNHVNPG